MGGTKKNILHQDNVKVHQRFFLARKSKACVLLKNRLVLVL